MRSKDAARTRRWYWLNRSKALLARKLYRARNHAKRLDYERRYRAANAEKIRAYQARYYAGHTEALKEAMRERHSLKRWDVQLRTACAEQARDFAEREAREADMLRRMREESALELEEMRRKDRENAALAI